MPSKILSVIVPTYNRSEVLKKCLNSFLRQKAPAGIFEVIVADDGSSDATERCVKEVSAGCQLRIRYLKLIHKGANHARNEAISIADGDLLLFINDDTIAVPEFVQEHIKWHEINPSEEIAILGKMKISPDIEPTIFNKLHLDASYEDLGPGKELGWRQLFTCNVSVKKCFLDKYGKFDENIYYHEDLELGERLSRYGLKVVYNEAALGYHYHKLEENEYLGIAEREGKALAFWYKKSPQLKEELAKAGLYLFLPAVKRIKYNIADILVMILSLNITLIIARKLSGKHKRMATYLYKKAFQFIKRKAIRNAIR